MDTPLEVIQDLGLSKNEAKLYLLLLKFGKMKATELSVKSSLQRPVVYDALRQLESKGLVGKAEMSGVLIFSPSPPSALTSFIDDKKDSLEKILPELSKRFESSEKTSISVLYGLGGIRMVLEDILQLKVDYYAFHGQMQFFDYMPKTMELFNSKRKKLGLRSKYLLLDVEVSRKNSHRMPLSDIKYIDPSTVSGGVWWTYADRLVLFVLRKEEQITIFIKSSELAKTFRKSFDIMFKSNAHK